MTDGVRVVLLLGVMPALLAGCFSAGRGDDVAQDTAARFIEQVNTDTCDEASGFDIDDATWTSACQATVDNLADGTTLPAAEMHAADSGEVQRNYIMLSPYRDVDDVAATLHIELDGDGLLATDATLSRIASNAAAAIGDTETFEYGTLAGDAVEPDGQALIEQVQDLLLSGDCDEIAALMAPDSEFPGVADTAACESVAGLYAANPPSEVSFTSAVYSVVDIPASDEAYGVTRDEGEDKYAFFDRVMEEISPVNRKVRMYALNPDLQIDAVLYEGQWYLLDIEIEVIDFVYDF